MFRIQWDKKKKIIASTALSVALISGVAFVSQVDFGTLTNSDNQSQSAQVQAEEAILEYTGYEVQIDGQLVGYATSRPEAFRLIAEAKTKLVADLGYEPEYDYSSEVNGVTDVDLEPTDTDVFVEDLASALYDSLDEILVAACVLKIDDFVVALEDEASVEEVLEKAQSLYVQDDSAITVELAQDEHNPLVMKPEVNVLSKELPDERTFMTSISGVPMEDLEASDDEFLEASVKEVVLGQDVLVVNSYVLEEEIQDVDTAVEMITKEHEEIKTYVVVSGDVPSTIAETNGMTTQQLYELNPGLKENATRIQIGDELTVMVPEPELYVTTIEDVIYTEIVNRDVVYVNDSDAFIGSYEVLEAGSDGLIEVRATVTKVNGTITELEITGETQIIDPVTEKQSRGVKALPVTTATGTFEVPILSYTFTSHYGYRWGRLHAGDDFAAPVGTAIKASDGGRVIQAGWDGGYGYSIEIDHGNGYTTKYGHCSALYVSVGDEVSQYETIAAVGSTGNSTGPHLHFEIRKNGKALDPELYINP